MFQSFRSHFCREQYYFCLSIPHLLMTPKVTVKSPGKEAKQKSQQGFSLTDLYIIHVYSTVYSTKLTYNLLSLEALLVHSSACSDIWFISGYGKGRALPPCSSQKPSIHSHFSTFASISYQEMLKSLGLSQAEDTSKRGHPAFLQNGACVPSPYRWPLFCLTKCKHLN